MAIDDEEGVAPPPTNPPDTTLLDRRLDALLAARLGGGGDGGGSSHLEARIAKLEAEVAHSTESIADMRATLRSVNDNMSGALQRLTATEIEIKHLPSKAFIVTVVTTTLATLAALILFQHQIQSLLRAGT